MIKDTVMLVESDRDLGSLIELLMTAKKYVPA